MTARSNNVFIISTGICPDEKCKMKLYFPYFESTVLCHQCGQKHEKDALKDVENITDIDSVFRNVLTGMLINALTKRGTEAVKVLGLSNYHCKLLSPLLTKYGMDRETGKAKALSEMNQGDIFDCGLFGDRAFLIDPEHISIEGFGRDLSGSMQYLHTTLELIKSHNNDEERLVPIHADGDGHCLVHAISRALVGRELFWHPLRCSLKRHLEENLQTYKEHFKEFVDGDDWEAIVNECDPDFLPPDGEILGLRNIHVFGLANVLKRPIILLDRKEYMEKTADYAALFLPILVPRESCRGKDNRLNKPLCIAWSSEGHNHYIPLVGIKKGPLPVLPRELLPEVYGGISQDVIEQYIEFDENNCCTIGGDRSLGDPYILRLVSAMEELFHSMYNVHPNLVSDVHHYLYACTGTVGVKPINVVKRTEEAVRDKRLYRCLTCNAINEQVLLPEWFKRTGLLFNMALRTHGVLRPNQLYAFPARGIFCTYDAKLDELVLDPEQSSLEKCSSCEGIILRRLRSDGSVIYQNKDRTKTPSKSSACGCGFKHFWDGKEYDNLPQQLTVNLEWNNKLVKDVVAWFENESDSDLNSNVYDVAAALVQRHFPGVFGIEVLQQSVVRQLLNQTSRPEVRPDAELRPSPATVSQDDCSPSKIIIGGTGILHREELGVSITEQKIRHRVETRAYQQQKRQALAKTESPEKSHTVAPTKIDHSKAYPQNLNESSVQKAAESSKFVKVATSDGREGKLELGEGITFETLQKWICDNFQIAPDDQTLKYGFPPQVLHASSAERGPILALSPGERIIVEVAQPNEPQQTKPSDSGVCENSILSGADWHRLVENFTKNVQDPLDVSLSSFTLAASLSGLSPWEYSKTVPDAFETGGIFYRQMKRDLGLDDKMHGKLPMFPDKVFAYNPDLDRIELCFQPHGHHQIKEGLEEKILKYEKEKNLQSCSSAGRNCSVTGNIRRNTDRVPFQGTGYTLKDSEVKSPQKENAYKVPFKSPPVLVRKGPGFSVLSHSNIPDNSDLERLQGLACDIVRDGLLEEEESNSVSVKKSSGQALPTARLMSEEVQHIESHTTLLSQTAPSTKTISDENNSVADLPKNDHELVSINSVHIPDGKDPDLPESNSSNKKDPSSPHGDCSDHPVDDSARDYENMDLVLNKGEESMYLSSSVLERNLEFSDETQAMDVDRILT